ncbi:MAG: DNA polymerase III subunit delta' [Oculatellaceae cyanobacterium bins.114]|nr:DNA polymerase III subunit delta' [Oculatellaceae cyanobacterium bins.114]
MVSSVFDALIGQSQAVELLMAAIERDRIAPAYLFVGIPGIGRSLAAQGFAELLLSPKGLVSPQLRSRIEQRNHPDLFWVEPTYLHQGKRISVKEAAELGVKRKTPPQIRLDQVREIAQFLGRPPLEAERAVVVLEQAESMADAAANGLLKTLEEPGKATLILIASSVDALLPTIVSRCQRVRFQRLSTKDVAAVLRRSGHEDVLQHPEILALAQGSPGEAIAHWQQLQTIDLELLETVTQPPRSLRHALELARQIDKELDVEAQLWFVDYLQHRYWQQQTHPQFLHLLETARRHLRGSVQSRLTWEVTLMGML